MMVRAEYQRTPIARMLIESVHPCVLDRAGRIADKEVIEHQPGERVKGMAPWGVGRRDAKAEAGVAEDPPGALISPAAEVEVGAKDYSVIAEGGQKMLSLKRAAGGPQPSVSRRTARVEVRAHHAEAAAAHADHRGYHDPSLEHEG
jgi:hypothetical protein